MSLEPDLSALLKRLKLGQAIPTLPDRLALARAQKLDYAAFLTLILADEESLPSAALLNSSNVGSSRPASKNG